jgi:hypothetical protein
MKKPKVMPDRWIVTWTPSRAISIGGKVTASRSDQKSFDSEKKAVSFVMTKLDERFRGTVRLHYPDDRPPYDFAMISARYDYLLKEERIAPPRL